MAAKYLNNDLHLELPENKRTPIYKCDICDKEIFEEDEFYEVDRLIYCPDCMEMHFKAIDISTDTPEYLSDLEHENIVG